MRNLPTGTVTFLFTDIEGSTRLLDELGAERYAEALGEHRSRLREVFASRGGVEVDTQGDAFFVAFSDAVSAAAAAAGGQSALAGGPIKVRMALHTGEPVVTDEGYVGVDVHRAARICSTSHGGQVVLSTTTRSLLDNEEVVDLGLHRLKDLGQPEKLFQLGTTKFPPLRSLNATNLPGQTSVLIGRELEVGELVELLAGARLVTVTGPGGTGKTRLALQVAAELVDSFGDGVFWVSLASVTEPALVFSTIATELGAKVSLAEHIDERRMLLLLDNLEQVLGAAPQLSSLLAACPNLHLLVTSRALLRIEGETEYSLAPLPIDDAVALFRQRAVNSEPEGVVTEICLRLDCLPLAVELAAARTSLFPPEELLTRLSQSLPLLTGGRRDAPERQRTLRSTIEWSYELLDEEEKTLFQDLSIFAGSFAVEGAEVVADARVDTLQSLVEKSLLRRWASGRLGMLQTIHEFALEGLKRSGRANDMRHRHADFLLQVVESANLTDESQGPQRHDLVRPEIGNIRAALEGCLENNEIERGLRIMVALEHFWVGTLPFEAIGWFERLMTRVDTIPEPLEAQVLRAWGGITFIVGRFDGGTELYEKSLAIYRRLGDELGAAHLLSRLVMPMLLKGDTVSARSMNDEALQICERHHDAKGLAVSVGTLADIEIAEGNSDLGLDLLRRSMALAEEAGFIWWKAANLAGTIEHLYALGRLEEAEGACRESIDLSHEIEERQWLIFSLGILARVWAHTNRVESAGTLWGAIEAEEALAPIGQWEAERADYLDDLGRFAGLDFERGRTHGRKLTLDEVVRFALDDEASPLTGRV
ncbi:MAG: hypothetical protein QOH26_1440 [Actinomycetota bacterium]|jgi:predicted ATPase/class 3 adenylate cyclase|nr:hypothetical protein [Actinomycetota bacterium]